MTTLTLTEPIDDVQADMPYLMSQLYFDHTLNDVMVDSSSLSFDVFNEVDIGWFKVSRCRLYVRLQ